MPFIIDDLLLASAAGAAIGGGTNALSAWDKKQKAGQLNANAGIQSAWSQLPGSKMGMGQTVDVPNPVSEGVVGAAKGGLTGAQMYTDLVKSPLVNVNTGSVFENQAALNGTINKSIFSKPSYMAAPAKGASTATSSSYYTPPSYGLKTIPQGGNYFSLEKTNYKPSSWDGMGGR